MLSSMRLEIQAQEDARDIGLETMQPVDHGHATVYMHLLSMLMHPGLPDTQTTTTNQSRIK